MINKELPNYRPSKCCRTCKHALASWDLNCYVLNSHKVVVNPEYICDFWELDEENFKGLEHD